MIVEANVRDVKIKTRKFRNQGKTVGLIKRTNGESIPVSMTRSEVDKYLGRFGDHSNMTINLAGEDIKASIVKIERDVVLHYAHHIELKEIEEV